MKTSFKIMCTFIMCLINLTLSTSALAKAANDPNCPKDYLYKGYDYVRGNPSTGGQDIDPGWKLAILTEETNRGCPLECISALTCQGEYQLYDMDTELDYYHSLYEKATVHKNSEGFLKSTAFTGSAEYMYQQANVFGLSLINVQAEGSCQLYKGSRDPNCYDLAFTPGFLNELTRFPLSTDEPGWFDKVYSFFNNYGTHTATDISIGARVSYESQFTHVNYVEMMAANVNVKMAAEASAEFKRTEGGSASYESEEQTFMREKFDLAAASQRVITVGSTPPTDISFGEWANNIDRPVPQSYVLSPISELLTPRVFPDDPNIDAKRKVMEAGYELYCSSVPNCHKPQLPKIVHVTDYSNHYQVQNSVEAACPFNYQVIGGGCKTDPTQEPGSWLLSSLKPNKNAFHCFASKDTGDVGVDYQGVRANATCLHNDYVDNIQTVPCEGAPGKFASECIAYCPTGYELTGGGCESDYPNDRNPWKVTMSNPYNGNEVERNGWHCKVSEDAETGIYNRKARGYAICTQFVEDTVRGSKIVTEKSGTIEKYTNGTEALCGAGFTVVGGGCSTPNLGNSNDEWKIIETQPSRSGVNGWSCLAQENLGTLSFYKDVQTDALCVNFKLN